MSERRCPSCGALLVRHGKENSSQFAQRRYCDRSCSAADRYIRPATSSPSPKKIAAPPSPNVVEHAPEWRVYRDLMPTRSVESLSEAKALAVIHNPSYAEIADFATGQHLMRFNGKWIETRPPGSPIAALRDKRAS